MGFADGGTIVLVISDIHGQSSGASQAEDARPDPPALLRRRDGILPTTAAALSLPERAQPLTGTASRSTPPPEPHPVVAEILAGLGTAQRERHLGRCPEPALLSRWLFETGAGSLEQARHALNGAGIICRHIREDGDPRHGAHAAHCRSCAVLLARLGVTSLTPAPAAARGGTFGGDTLGGPTQGAPWSVGTVDQALEAAGWRPGRGHAAKAEAWADVLSGHRSPQGHPHELFPAAFETWAELGEITLQPNGPGVAFAPSAVVIDPLAGLHWARVLSDLGYALGGRLAPLGEELGSGALLALDTEGRLYGIDHSGDWYLGHDVLTGLATLLTGAAPHRLEP
ncbi:YwqJ-like deaminase [Streptomyces zhaozhouensis]|uniref:YwqJ-like deaminase n=1 Tax=Streptomyces zhaozhouensis TaxID=1300267 RepID=A0A286DXQ5_9ACTN|nr:YwqJ-like deaminase [Streptomyces zhaozhouensis]